MDTPQHSVELCGIELSYGSTEVLKKLDLSVKQGEFLVLLGPSGCGKSTLLNCIAGLLDVNGGKVYIQGRDVTREEPSRRGIGMVFQSYALYPQMTVKGNLSFGLKNQKLPKSVVEERVARAAQILRIESLLHRKPHALSGGQRQRVAIGRALVRDVDVFLFDEPLSSLDARLRTDLRVELKRLHRSLGNTMVYVTHDQVEAMTLADRIAVMKDGAIQQLSSPAAIYAAPVNKYVADFIGSPAMNFVDGELSNEIFQCSGFNIPLSGYNFKRAAGQSGNRPVTFGIRPEHIRTGLQASHCSFQNTVEVDLVEPMGADTLVWTTLADLSLRVRVEGQSGLKPGDTLLIGFDAQHASLFDRSSELRL